MRHIGSLLLATGTALCCGGVQAQDLFSSTNTTVHSYNYVEVQYLIDMDTKPPVLASAVLDITENWSLKAEYIQQDFGDIAGFFGESIPEDVIVTLEGQIYSAGALYHKPLESISQSDWIAGFMFGRLEAELKAPQFGVSESFSESFSEIYAGIRRTLTTELEGEVAVNYYRSSDSSEVTGDVKLVYRLNETFDVALAGNELGGENVFGIGLRYAW